MCRAVRALSFAAILLCPFLVFAQSHSATLSWTPATQPSGITIASWNVLRGTTTGGPYTQIANVPVGTTSYTDSSVSSGSTCYYVVQAVDTSGAVSAYSTEVTATIPTSAPPLAVATTSLPAATAGASYSATITASGGTGPYTWSGTGVDGLTFSATGLLSGTPTQAGTFPQGVTVNDSAGATASASLTLSVAAALAISTTQLPAAAAGTSYSVTLTATGGTAPYTWSGTGVDGLTFSATGILSGTPVQAGTFTQAITVNDSTGATASASLTLTVAVPAVPLAVSTTTLPPATAGTSYSVTLTATGGTAPYTWSGTGVDGLTFSATGILSGTPTQAGTFPQSVTVKDSAGATASASLTLTVAAALAISTTTLPPATAGASYSATITASGGTAPYTWSGTGVDGLTFSATGILSGTPTQAGTFPQSVTVKDSTGATASASLTLTVTVPAVPLAVSTTTLPPATAGASYSATITASGGTAPYTWFGTGIDGLTFSGTGLLSGTPSQAGIFTQSVTVKDSTGATAGASLTLTVASTSGGGTSITLMQHTSKDAGTTTSSTLTFPSNNTASNWIAVSIRAGAPNETFTVTDTNGNTYRKAIQFTLTADSDSIGIFYAENIAGGANTVTVSDTALDTLRFAILEYSGVATSGSLDGVAVTQGNSVSPNSGSVTTTANGDLLLGAIITAGAETYTAGIGYRIEENVPAEPGTKLITEDQVQAAAGAAVASATLGMANPWAAGIAAFKVAGSGGGTAPTITSSSSTMFTVGAAGSFTVTTTGTPTPSLSESGTLPTGVMFTDNGNGSAMLSGTPASGSGGTYSLTLTATNGVGTPASQSFTLTVASAPLAVSTTSLPPATAGIGYNATIVATGGTAPYTWSGTGVDGLTLSGTGLLSGTPSQTGTFPQGVTVKDSTGATASASLTLSVAAALAISTTQLPAATVGTSYSVTLTATGGTAPYTWSGTGVDGLTFSATGLLSGTPAQAGTFPQSITVQDSTGATASASLTLTVAAALAISTTSLPPAIAGASYSVTLTASGGTAPYIWSGTGVDGLTLSATGLLSGIPTQAGTFPQIVTVQDPTGATASASLILTVAGALMISTTQLPAATAGTIYSVTLTASGGTAPYTWSGTGVDGLTLSTTGLLSGTPTQAGAFPQIVTVKDSTGATASASLILTVASTSGGGTSITLVQHTSKDAGITTSSALTFASNNTASNWIAVCIRAGAANETFTVTDTNGNTYRKAIQFNLTVDSDTIAIFYTENIAGGTNTVTVSDTVLDTLRLAILEYSGVATSGSLDGVAVTQGNNASPNSGSVTTTANGDLLLGAIITAGPETFTAGMGYRIEESVPAQPGTKLITEDQVQAAAGAAAVSATLGTPGPWAAGVAAFRVGSSGAGTAPTITSAGSTIFAVGTAGTFSVTTTGSPTPSLSESGALPTGVTFTDNGNRTGTLSGTPASGSGGTYSLTLTATNGVGTPTSQSFTLTVASPLAVSTTSLPPATAGTSYSVTLTATGGTAPYTWSGTGVDGLTFSEAGLLSGTPTQAGTFTQLVTVKDFTGASASASLPISITVNVQAPPPTVYIDTPAQGSTVSGVVSITGWAVDNAAAVGTAISSVQVKVDGTGVGIATYGLSRPDVCAAYPGRPGCPNVGYSFSLNTSTLSVGTHTITITATDSDATPDSASSSVTVNVQPSAPTVWIDTPTSGATVSGIVSITGWAVDNAATVGTAISSVQVKVDGTGVGIATYGLSRPDVCAVYPGRPGCPNVGYSFSLNTSTLSVGSHTITVTATDSDGTPDTGSASVTVTR